MQTVNFEPSWFHDSFLNFFDWCHLPPLDCDKERCGGQHGDVCAGDLWRAAAIESCWVHQTRNSICCMDFWRMKGSWQRSALRSSRSVLKRHALSQQHCPKATRSEPRFRLCPSWWRWPSFAMVPRKIALVTTKYAFNQSKQISVLRKVKVRWWMHSPILPRSPRCAKMRSCLSWLICTGSLWPKAKKYLCSFGKLSCRNWIKLQWRSPFRAKWRRCAHWTPSPRNFWTVSSTWRHRLPCRTRPSAWAHCFATCRSLAPTWASKPMTSWTLSPTKSTTARGSPFCALTILDVLGSFGFAQCFGWFGCLGCDVLNVLYFYFTLPILDLTLLYYTTKLTITETRTVTVTILLYYSILFYSITILYYTILY